MGTSSLTTVRVLERKSNRIVEDISGGFRSLHWTERARRYGTGGLRIAADDLSREAVSLVTTGNGALHIVREWREAVPVGQPVLHTDEVFGPILTATVRDGDSTVVRTDFSGVRNEIVVLGANEGAARDVVRRTDTASQSQLGMREIVVDARHLSLTSDYEQRGDAELAERLEPQRTLTAGGAPQGGFEWDLAFADNLVYLHWRHTDTEGELNIDPGSVTAGEYIRSLLTSELLAPSISRRQIDVPAVLAGVASVGDTISLPVRWKNVADTVREACVAGSVRVTSTVNADLQIAYSVAPVRDRTSGSTNAVIWSRENAQREWDVRAGDVITVEEYVRGDSVTPDVGPLDALCVARTISVQPGRPDSVRLEIGAEIPTDASLLRGVDRRSEDARFA